MVWKQLVWEELVCNSNPNSKRVKLIKGIYCMLCPPWGKLIFLVVEGNSFCMLPKFTSELYIFLTHFELHVLSIDFYEACLLTVVSDRSPRSLAEIQRADMSFLCHCNQAQLWNTLQTLAFLGWYQMKIWFVNRNIFYLLGKMPTERHSFHSEKDIQIVLWYS